jgi:hypothetical protein
VTARQFIDEMAEYTPAGKTRFGDDDANPTLEVLVKSHPSLDDDDPRAWSDLDWTGSQALLAHDVKIKLRGYYSLHMQGPVDIKRFWVEALGSPALVSTARSIYVGHASERSSQKSLKERFRKSRQFREESGALISKLRGEIDAWKAQYDKATPQVDVPNRIKKVEFNDVPGDTEKMRDLMRSFTCDLHAAGIRVTFERHASDYHDALNFALMAIRPGDTIYNVTTQYGTSALFAVVSKEEQKAFDLAVKKVWRTLAEYALEGPDT